MDQHPPTFHHGLAPRENRSTLILVMGILSLVFLCSILGLIFGIIGLKCANTDMAEIAAGRVSAENSGVIKAGRTCAIIGVILGSIGTALTLVYIGFIVFVFIGTAAAAAGAGAGAGAGGFIF